MVDSLCALCACKDPSDLSRTMKRHAGSGVDKAPNGGVPMLRPRVDQPDPNFSAAYAILQSQEPLPPYELDPSFHDPDIRKRVGAIIAQTMGQRISKVPR